MQRPFIHIFLIAVIGLLAYSNTFHVPFQFDDYPNIVENPNIKDIRSFAHPSEAKAFEFSDAFKSRWIGYFSLALNYRLRGFDITGYHIVNLAVHITNAILVYWLALLAFQTPYLSNSAQFPHHTVDERRLSLPIARTEGGEVIALLSGLLFVSHPIQTQAVTYIVQRFASLATMFYLCSFVFYVQWRRASLRTRDPERATRRLHPAAVRRTPLLWYLSSVLCAVLAMKTKEIAFTLPLVIALYEFLFFEGPIKRRFLVLTPFFFTLFIIPLTLIGTGKPVGEIIGDIGEATRLQTSMARGDYLFTQLSVIVTYIRLLFMPVNQNLDYDYPLYHSFFDAPVFLSFLLLASLFSFGVYLIYRARFLSPVLRLTAFGIFWFFITLSVESSVIPIADVIFEHRLYLPSAGAFVAFAAATHVVVRHVRELSPPAGKIAPVAFAVLIAALAWAAHERNAVWRDELSLWSDVLEKSPCKGRALNNVGNIYYNRGAYDRAEGFFLKAMTADPPYPLAYFNMGVLVGNFGRHEEAAAYFTKTLALSPTFRKAYVKRGIAYLNSGNSEKARANFYRACVLNDPEACALLSTLKQ